MADSIGVYVGDEDGEWWDGYRQGQRQALMTAQTAAATVARTNPDKETDR